ncbi:MAG: phosphoribosylglycinamide formyltransferase [Bacteroidetes bacterium]|nr:phosphoribosylglycinamide formyltransferase [Bacteroidota bacterium]
MKKSRLAIFASGSGTNAEAIMAYFQNHSNIEVAAVVTNKADAFVLERAKKFNVSTKVFSNNQFRECDEVTMWLEENKITHIVLAGFLLLIPEKLIEAFSKKIVNIHPSLLPKFGGKGMHGMNVHNAVKAAGETETGITIHLVNEQYDEGEILAQVKCTIEPNDNAEAIAKKVLQLEHENYPKIIEQWATLPFPRGNEKS